MGLDELEGHIDQLLGASAETGEGTVLVAAREQPVSRLGLALEPFLRERWPALHIIVAPPRD